MPAGQARTCTSRSILAGTRANRLAPLTQPRRSRYTVRATESASLSKTASSLLPDHRAQALRGGVSVTHNRVNREVGRQRIGDIGCPCISWALGPIPAVRPQGRRRRRVD